jgi:hypothetical protein
VTGPVSAAACSLDERHRPVTCWPGPDGERFFVGSVSRRTRQGSSFAAPQVAGVVDGNQPRARSGRLDRGDRAVPHTDVPVGGQADAQRPEVSGGLCKHFEGSEHR